MAMLLVLATALAGPSLWNHLLAPTCISVDFAQMSDFPLDQRGGTMDDIPASWRALDGKHVKMSGMVAAWINTTDASHPSALLTTDAHLRNEHEPPRVQQVLYAYAKAGVMTDPTGEALLTVAGTLHVMPKRDSNGILSSVFSIDVDRLEPDQAPPAPFFATWQIAILCIAGVITGLWVLVWVWVAYRLQRRAWHGLCPACGYDLRGTPERCPECGAVSTADGARLGRARG
jgi:hypothetical protein